MFKKYKKIFLQHWKKIPETNPIYENCWWEIAYTTVFQNFYLNSSKLIKYNKKLAKKLECSKTYIITCNNMWNFSNLHYYMSQHAEYIKSTLLHASTFGIFQIYLTCHSMQNTCNNMRNLLNLHYNMQQHAEYIKSALLHATPCVIYQTHISTCNTARNISKLYYN